MGAGLGQLVAMNESSKPDFAKQLPRPARSECSERAAERRLSARTREHHGSDPASSRVRVMVDAGLIDIVAKDLLRLVSAPLSRGRRRSDADDQRSVVEPSSWRDWRIDWVSFVSVGEPARDRHRWRNASHGAMLTLPKLHAFQPLDSASKITGVTRPLDAGFV